MVLNKIIFLISKKLTSFLTLSLWLLVRCPGYNIIIPNLNGLVYIFGKIDYKYIKKLRII